MSLAFILILVSAFFHASYNLLIKTSENKISYNIHIQIACAIIVTIYTILFHIDAFYYHAPTIMYALLSSFFFALYQYFTAISYKYADVSLVYPITTSSPLFIIIWAYLFLDEKVTILGVFGIILLLFGCYIINITKGSFKSAFYGIALAFLAAFLYSFGAMADKIGVSSVNTHLYILLMSLFISFYSIIFIIITSRKSITLHKYIFATSNYKLVILGGLAMALSTITYRLGLVDIQVSYAGALRQLSSFFGVIMGIFLLKEPFSVQRIMGSAIIILGIVLIRVSI